MKKFSIAFSAVLLFSVCVIFYNFFTTANYYFGKDNIEIVYPTNHNIKHMALIMDGNRRWAKKNLLKTAQGHAAGAEAIKNVVSFAINAGIPNISLYAFSTENFNRSEEEKNGIFKLACKWMEQFAPTCMEKGIRIRFIGETELFPEDMKLACKDLEEKTASFTNLTLNVLLGYGGRREIVQAVKSLAHQVKEGKITENQIDENILHANLWLGSDTPDPEIVVRTGYEKRLSNFLTFQTVYSELFFLDCFWPEITEKHLCEVVETYQKRKRNFGA
ncbi:MAG: Isoprenyl transferase [candidate division TM6 bacterium GW2011_GWF2_32_72]|nr:MAG: Isoprenyl transferase [candidate division TM6 bacterium GW2011_GWF2_32_72]